MDKFIKTDVIQAEHILFVLALNLHDEEAREKCKQMADYLRGKLYDPKFEQPILFSKDSDCTIKNIA